MFCTACSADNPIVDGTCAACGARLRRRVTGDGEVRAAGVAGTGGAKRPDWIGRVRVALAVALPVAMLAAGGGYWRSEHGARAAAYDRGAAALAGGRYVEAGNAFAVAGGYRDAAARRAVAEAALEPYRVAYLDAVTALATGDNARAIGLLIPIARDMPDYRDAVALLAEARRRWEQELYRAIEAATERRDWLVVERALSELVEANSEDANLQARLAELRAEHAPLIHSRGRSLYLVGPDGADERLVLDELPAVWPVWSPDRSTIAFVSPDRLDFSARLSLYVVEPDGSAPRKLADWLRPYAAPVWSPDGAWIAYASQAPERGNEGSGDPPRLTVRIVEVATGRTTDLTGDRLQNAASPSWSPDGRRLAVVSRNDEGLHEAGLLPSGEVYVVTVATGEVSDLGRGRIGHPWRLAWSPAAEAVVVSTRQPGMSYEADRSPLYLVHVATGELTNLNTRLAEVSMPAWSPDGQRFAYIENETTVRVRGLNLAEEDRFTTLDARVVGAVSWSPGGDALLAVGAPGEPSFVIPLGEEFGRERAVALVLDVDARQAGTPEWSAVNPAPPPTAPTAAGTARDPAVVAAVAVAAGERPTGAR